MTTLSEDIHRTRMEKLAQWVGDTVALYDMAGLGREEKAFVAVIGMLIQTLVAVMQQNTMSDDKTIRDFLDAGIGCALQASRRTNREEEQR